MSCIVIWKSYSEVHSIYIFIYCSGFKFRHKQIQWSHLHDYTYWYDCQFSHKAATHFLLHMTSEFPPASNYFIFKEHLTRELQLNVSWSNVSKMGEHVKICIMYPEYLNM